MAIAPVFKELLRKNLDDVKKPEAIPAGTYRGVLKSFSFGESTAKKTPYVQYEVIPSEAMEGVDQDELVAALQGTQLSTKKLRCTYYLTEDAMWRLKEMIASLGVDMAGRTLDEVLPDTNGKGVIFEVTQRPSQDGSAFYNDVGTVKGEAA